MAPAERSVGGGSARIVPLRRLTAGAFRSGIYCNAFFAALFAYCAVPAMVGCHRVAARRAIAHFNIVHQANICCGRHATSSAAPVFSATWL